MFYSQLEIRLFGQSNFLISNFEVLLEVVVELLAQMVERAVVAGDWFEEFETNCLVEKLEWPWVEAQGIGFALLDSVVGAHC